MTNYPTYIDSYNNPTSSTKTNAPGFDHARLHSDVNDSIRAIQTKIGIDNSIDETTLENKVNRLLNRSLVNQVIGTGDGIETIFPLPFDPVGDVITTDDNMIVESTVFEIDPGVFELTFPVAPIGIVRVIAIKE